MTNSPVHHSAGRILVADDDEVLLRAFARILKSAGFEVETVTSGTKAVESFRMHAFDAVVCDISMPDVDGLEVTRQIRDIDTEVPVILVTGAPTVATAIAAVERGALRYLVKPIDPDELLRTVSDAARLSQLASLRRQANAVVQSQLLLSSSMTELEESFDRSLVALFLAYQPIVSVSNQTTFGHEALLRTKEPSMPHPGAFFAAAEKLGRVSELSRRIRGLAPALLRHAPRSDGAQTLFINLHARDLADDALLIPDPVNDPFASRIVYEVSERASLEDLGLYRTQIASLRERGYRIAVDDLGAGYAGLSSFALLEPEIVKLDMELVRGVDASLIKQKVIRSLVQLCTDMGVQVISEGVETRAESETLSSLGCDLQQGYLFAKPAFPPVDPKFA
jgi:EAL domain-containing protein (putative c-di-GMP-specific phosphodiesterase class I)/CheY-like chemotaxis protein